MRLTVKGDVRRIQRDLGRLNRRDEPRAVAAALNRTRSGVKTRAVRRTARKVGAKQKLIRPRIVFGARAKARRLWTKIGLRVTHGIPFEAFGKPRQVASGVTSRAGSVPGGWIMPDNAGKPKSQGGVFVREGKSRLPIERIRRDISDEARTATDRVARRAGPALFRKAFRQQVRRYIKKGMRR